MSFYERLHPDLYLYQLATKGDLLSLARKNPWVFPTTNHGLAQIHEWMDDKGLKAYILTRKHGLMQVKSDHIRSFGWHGVLFHIDDLIAFSKENPDELKLSTNPTKDKVQKYAKQKWGPEPRDPRPTLADMTTKVMKQYKHQLLKKDGTDYSVSAVKGWLRKLGLHDPDRRTPLNIHFSRRKCKFFDDV